MKKSSLLLSALIAMSLGLAACDDHKDTDTHPADTPTSTPQNPNTDAANQSNPAAAGTAQPEHTNN